jgi:hypothetical protein
METKDKKNSKFHLINISIAKHTEHCQKKKKIYIYIYIYIYISIKTEKNSLKLA